MLEQNAAVGALAALAHDARLSVFRLLVQAGREGLPAGEISDALSIPPTALSFHLARLRHAALITARRQGRRIIYAADFAAMQRLVGFLTENCCGRSPTGCGPDCAPPQRLEAPAGRRTTREPA